jgi:uncharacterized C2H2 Zn-finger protein
MYRKEKLYSRHVFKSERKLFTEFGRQVVQQ